jgi:dihydropyrimidinase
MNVDYSAYEGMKVKGVTKMVLARGRVVVEDGNYTGKAGDGEFIRRSAFSNLY